MSQRYRLAPDGSWIDKTTGEPMQAPERICRPMVVRDVAYQSPLTGREVTSRSQRREEMKRHGVREVDPSEFTPRYARKKNADAHRRDREVLSTVPTGDAPYERLSRNDLPTRIARTIAQTTTR